jgi:hypothetical protein
MQTKVLFFLLLICISLNSFTQPVIKSQRTIGSGYIDRCNAISVTKDEGLIAGGTSGIGDGENNRGQTNYWIVKLDSFHNTQWSKAIGGNYDDDLTCLQQTNDGGYILGGYSVSGKSGEKTENSRGKDDYWVAKLDSLGNVQWDKTIGGKDYDQLNSIEQTNDKGYILGGFSWSNISGEKTEDSRGMADYWVVKLDSSGNIEWDKTIGGNDFDGLYSIQQTLDRGYILGGHSSSNVSGEKTENSRGKSDYWIVKLDSNGIIEWNKTIGGNYYEDLRSCQQTNDGGYILGGSSESGKSGEKSQNGYGDWDYWVVKLNDAGNIQWDKTIGGSVYDALSSLQKTSDKGYILGGYSSSDKSGDKTENNRGQFSVTPDYWVVKLNGNGVIQWDKTVGGDNGDELTNIMEISTNHYALGGYSNSDSSGDKTQSSLGNDDYWIVWLDDGIILPVTIINLKAYEQGHIVKIDWTSLIEVNIANYEIQRSSDNLDFATVGIIPAAITYDTKIKNYSYNDLHPLKAYNYYRLKITDKDGKISFSNTAWVNIHTDKSAMVIYPIPAKNVLHIQTNEPAVFVITNQSGKILISKTINKKEDINIANLPAGVYYIKNTATGELRKIIIAR